MPQTSFDERAELYLEMLKHECIDVPEMTKWNDGIRYCADFLDRIPLPKIPLVESLNRAGGYVALRHDCDHSMINALGMAKAEYLRGYSSTYFLLPPNGFSITGNYFGIIEDGRLRISPHLVDAAKYLEDLGHEVGIHNDAITLALFLKRNPAELLAEQINFFERHGINIQGTASHGPALARQAGYVNYQIFREFKSDIPGPVFASPVVEWNGYSVEKYSTDFASLGLKYEAYKLPRDIYFSDSGAQITLSADGTTRKSTSTEESRQFISECASAAIARPNIRIQLLVHPCHWLHVVCGNRSVAKAVVQHHKLNK